MFVFKTMKILIFLILSLIGQSPSSCSMNVIGVPENCNTDIAGRCVRNKTRYEGILNYQLLKVHPMVKYISSTSN